MSSATAANPALLTTVAYDARGRVTELIVIDPDAGVYPMVGPGQAYDEMITGDWIPSRNPPAEARAPGPSEMF